MRLCLRLCDGENDQLLQDSQRPDARCTHSPGTLGSLAFWDVARYELAAGRRAVREGTEILEDDQMSGPAAR